MPRFVCLILLIIPTVIYCQDYEEYVARGEFAFQKGDYTVSVQYYDSAFRLSAGSQGDLYNAACANAKAGNLSRSVAFAAGAIDKGFNFDWLYYDQDLNAIRFEPGYLLLEKKYRLDSAIYIFDIVRELRHRDHVIFTGKRISLNEYLLSMYSPADLAARMGMENVYAPGDSLMDFRGKSLEFRDCLFDNDGGMAFNELANLAIRDLLIVNCRGNVSLRNIDVGNLHFWESQRKRNDLRVIRLQNIKQHGQFMFAVHGEIAYVQNSSFNILRPEDDDFTAVNWIVNVDRVEVSNVTFQTVNPEMEPFNLEINGKDLTIANSAFEHPILLKGTATGALNIYGNTFARYVDFFGFKFPEYNCYIPFGQFADTKFVAVEYLDDGGIDIAGDSLSDMDEGPLFDKLTSFYKRLYDNYRSRADIASANDAYVQLKELEIAHLKMKSDRNLEETMRLRLNQLMGSYTDHATSPGKAILISFYIILFFGVFYFFFPSEWDKSSKAQLVSDFKVFAEKNEHGYVRPFFKMTKGFLLSFLNAVTLSMNAFITLGFGNIPAIGLARYICILQGLIGWFLLSLFTVALLNQVLL